MTKEQKRVKEKTSRKPAYNGWKWAFLILVGILAGGVLWIIFHLTTPSTPSDTEMDSTNTNSPTSDTIQLEVRAEKEELKLLANQYLTQESDNQSVTYELAIEENISLLGELTIFGIPMDFELEFEPYVMQNGDLQLRATSLSLGNLLLPISFVMNQIERQLDLPEWVVIQPDTQFIIVKLSEFSLNSGIYFSMEHIDLENNDIRIHVFVPREN